MINSGSAEKYSRSGAEQHPASFVRSLLNKDPPPFQPLFFVFALFLSRRRTYIVRRLRFANTNLLLSSSPAVNIFTQHLASITSDPIAHYF